MTARSPKAKPPKYFVPSHKDERSPNMKNKQHQQLAARDRQHSSSAGSRRLGSLMKAISTALTGWKLTAQHIKALSKANPVSRSSGVRGITWDKPRGKWQVRGPRVAGKPQTPKLFPTTKGGGVPKAV